MPTDRITALRTMLERNPGDARALFGLALEYERTHQWQLVADTLRDYLDRTDDEGNAWGRLGKALTELGRTDEARDAYQRGIEAAMRHGHPTMAQDLEETLSDLS